MIYLGGGRVELAPPHIDRDYLMNRITSAFCRGSTSKKKRINISWQSFLPIHHSIRSVNLDAIEHQRRTTIREGHVGKVDKPPKELAEPLQQNEAG